MGIKTLIFEYGLWNFYKLHRLATHFISSFAKIYPLQKDGAAYENAFDLYGAMGISEYFNGNGLNWLMADGLGINKYVHIHFYVFVFE